MRIKFYLRGDEASDMVKSELMKLFINKDKLINFVQEKPDLVIAIGGDGTVLRAISENYDGIDNIEFVGIMTGTLGFYADFSKDNLECFVDMICNRDFKIVKKRIMEYEVCTLEKCEYGYALNEIALVNPYATQVVEIHIDGQYFYTSRGTGICISTSSGSTAYNKSLGGAVVDNSLNILQITEMASINSNAYKSLNSPLILSEDREVTLRSPSFERVTFTSDAINKQLNGYDYIKCKASKKSVKLISKNDFDFIDRVKKAFL